MKGESSNRDNQLELITESVLQQSQGHSGPAIYAALAETAAQKHIAMQKFWCLGSKMHNRSRNVTKVVKC